MADDRKPKTETKTGGEQENRFSSFINANAGVVGTVIIAALAVALIWNIIV